MEKENKKSSGGAIVITAIILLVLFGGCLFILNKQGYLSFDKNDNEIISNQQDTNNTINNNVIDLTKLDTFKNYDGTYGSMETLNIVDERGYNYLVVLYLDGEVKVYNPNYEKPQAINVSDIVQIAYASADKCYLLDKNRQVYVYELANSDNRNYNVTKVDNASNVVKLLSINYSPVANGAGAASLIGIKADGSYVSLDSFSR